MNVRGALAGLRQKAASFIAPTPTRGVMPGYGFPWPWISEPYTGAWQNDDEKLLDSILSSPPVYAVVTLIANDIAKMRMRLMDKTPDGIWAETEAAAFSPVLRRPNYYQNHIQFKQWWLMSKLTRGNTYVLKRRDARGVVNALYILDPTYVQPLVASDGSIYYQLNQDNLTGVAELSVTVPSSEIIHDRMNCLFHPLVGISPLFAAALPASQGLAILRDTKRFFSGGAKPGGILIAPGAISDENAKEVREYWDQNFTGKNSGKVAVLGDGMRYEQLRMTSVDAQTTEQLKLTAEMVAQAFHVPPFKIGIGTLPAGQKVDGLNQIYYTDCLQILIEEFEACMDEGLGLDTVNRGVELDLANLLRMDEQTQIAVLGDSVGKSLRKVNEARRLLNLPPVEGGDTIYMQQQNYSLAALDERDRNDPFGKEAAPPPAPAPGPEPEPEPDPEEQARELIDHIRKGLEWT